MKKLAIVLLAVLMFACGVALIACQDNAAILDLYIFEKEGQVVSGEFELPNTIGELNVTWTSSDSNLIKITDRKAEGKNFLATVTRPDKDQKEVTLTVTAGGASKNYTVYVKAIDVFDIANAYKFPQEKQSVTADFDLATKATLEGKEAKIVWSIAESFQDHIKVNSDGNKCLVTPSSLDPEVRIQAKFAFGGEETTKTYRLVVSKEKTTLELRDYWYNNTGVSVPLKGWVVEIAAAYSESYGNISFYMVDEQNEAGYYVYRVKADAENGKKVKVGSYVEVTGATNTSYSGLMETNAGGNCVVVDSKAKTPEEMKALVYALDNDILGKVPEAIFHTSQYVSLEGWTVDSVTNPAATDLDKDLFKITKNKVTITVRISKYMEGAYSNKNDQVAKDILALQTTLQKGDIVNLKGILGNYNGYTLNIVDAKDVVKSTSPALTDDEIKALPGVKVGNVITEIKKVITNNNLDLIVTKAKDAITFPASTDDVTVKYEIIGAQQGADVAITEAGVLTIAAPTKHDRVHVHATLTSGEYTTDMLFYVETWNKTDKQMVEDEHLQLFVDDFKVPGTTILPIVGNIYGANVSIAWELAEKNDLVSITDNKDFSTNKVVSKTLAVGGNPEDYTVKLKATITAGEETMEKELTIKVAKFVPATKVETKDGKQVLTVATKEDFAAYSASWSTSYSAKELTNETFNIKDTAFKLNISNADKQTGTITDMPNMASKSTAPVYVTLAIDNATISAISFKLKEWNDSKLFTSIYVEYTTDPEATKDDADKWIAIDADKCGGWKDVADGKRIGKDGLEITASAVPENAVQVRLVIVAVGTGNTQVGLESVVATFAPKAKEAE